MDQFTPNQQVPPIAPKKSKMGWIIGIVVVIVVIVVLLLVL